VARSTAAGGRREGMQLYGYGWYDAVTYAWHDLHDPCGDSLRELALWVLCAGCVG
jgi:hypothetical protein